MIQRFTLSGAHQQKSHSLLSSLITLTRYSFLGDPPWIWLKAVISKDIEYITQV